MKSIDVEKYNRRQFFYITAGAVGGLDLTLGLNLPIFADYTKRQVATLKENPVFELSREELIHLTTQFEARAGYSTLTFEQAQAAVPLLTALYCKAGNPTRLNAKDLARKVYIVRGYSDEKQRIAQQNSTLENNSVVQQFLRDYPHVSLSYIELDAIRGYSLSGHVLGWAGENNRNAFLMLSAVNSVVDPKTYIEGHLKNTEWQQIPEDGKLICQDSRPAVTLRTVAWHELTHVDSGDGISSFDLDPSIMESYRLLSIEFHPDSPTAFINGTTLQFGNQLFASHPQNDIYDIGLREFSTDMLAAIKSFSVGLPYVMSAYDMQQDYGNLLKVLSQIKLTPSQFSSLYYASQLKEFFALFANGASNTNFGSPIEMYTFAAKLWTLENALYGGKSKREPWGSSYGPDWSNFKPHFPQVDATAYHYNDKFSDKRVKPLRGDAWNCLAKP